MSKDFQSIKGYIIMNIHKSDFDEREKWISPEEVTEGLLELEEDYTATHYDVESTNRAKELAEKYSSNLSGYAGKYENLVSSVDGVGTKIILAQYARASFNRPLNSIGQDVVAMVVNDLLCKGAKPLFFLDYFASSKIPNDQFHEVLAGIYQACIEIGIPLLGGETAKLPGIITEGTFDVAGFGVGRIECKDDELPRDIRKGDVLIGIKSSGFHANGFTLIRKNIGWRESGNEPFLSMLLKPTKIYVNDIKKLSAITKERIDPTTGAILIDPTTEMPKRETIKIKGLAHITGNGFDNIKRILPDNDSSHNDSSYNMKVKYDDSFLYENDYPAHADMFRWIQENEGLTMEQMYATFNCGIGMVLIVSPEDAEILEKPIINAQYVKDNIFRMGTVT